MFLFGPPDVEKMKARRDVKGLIKALGYQKHHQSYSVRQAAAKALGEIGDTRAVPPLISVLENEQEFSCVHEAVVKALVAIGAHAVELLIAALGNKHYSVRADAAMVLGEIGDAHAVPPLIVALKKDENAWVRRDAARALGQIGDARAVEPLIAALKDRVDFVRHFAAEALGQIGDARAVEPLITALKDESQDVRREAAKALFEIGAPAVGPLIAALKDDKAGVRVVAAQVLGRIGDARAVEPLIAALKDESKGVRKTAAQVLGGIGDTRAIEQLIVLLRDKDKDVRTAAAKALDRLGWQPKTDEMQSAYSIAKGDWDTCVRITTAEEANAAWKQANEFYDQGDFQAAIRLYTLLLESEVGVDRPAIKEVRAMACCKVGLYEQAEQDLGELVDMLRRFRPDVSGSKVVYWYLVARYRGDEQKAMEEWLRGSLP